MEAAGPSMSGAALHGAAALCTECAVCAGLGLLEAAGQQRPRHGNTHQAQGRQPGSKACLGQRGAEQSKENKFSFRPHPFPPPPGQVEELGAKATAAEAAFVEAEEVASAAMEAAEEAVRDEMECITGG